MTKISIEFFQVTYVILQEYDIKLLPKNITLFIIMLFNNY